jgi:hypothetical protein
LQELQRNADASRNIYEQFLQRYKATSEQSRLQNSRVQIVSQATAPTRPTRPALPLLLAAFAIAAILCSFAIVGLIESARDGTQPTPEAGVRGTPPAADREAPSIPVWGRIPNSAVLLGDKLGWRKPTERGSDVDLRAHLLGLLEMIIAAPTGRGKVVLVTSAEPGIGKSSVARSLNAAAIDRGMLSVLVDIEAEPNAARRPRLPFSPAASDRGQVLQTTANSLKLLLDDSRKSHVPAAPGDVRSEFDLIVIDAPIDRQHDDVAAIAANSDFTVLVTTDGATKASMLPRAMLALIRSGNTKLGMIINNPGPASPSEIAGGGWHFERSTRFA